MKKTKIKIKFPKEIKIIHIPFLAKITKKSPYDELREEIEKVIVPKSARFISARFELVIDLRKGKNKIFDLSSKRAEIIVEK